tara:strand:- start:1659 stop:2156 length:498 start_codon:yes stop_codon:yes gene_type:complete
LIFFWQIFVLFGTLIYITINSNPDVNPWIIPNLPLAILITMFIHRFFTSALVATMPITILLGLSSNEDNITFLLVLITVLISGSLIIFPQKNLLNQRMKMFTIATLTGVITSLIYIFLLMLVTDDLSLIVSLHQQIISAILITGITTGALTFILSSVLNNREYMH